ncbi:2-isopropylmalate synthase [Desulfocucumis palustris]|uniref:2-isopropylmalate synthase n=1 Tax=Desulfocucumis palustris TaxID=1898651 RepID=A0A2L2XAW5_9FIRM|nr:hypothetical protein [Desulfocucumis palustris]GBF33318.1 2-isopropylmalate synthase [Desulfocucumis palustris]
MNLLNLEQGPWKTNRSWVSHFNFLPEVRSGISFPKQVTLHDSTLRDGEQAPAVVFSKEDKLEIARGLSKAGIHYIEAAFPAVSREDQAALERIAGDGLQAKITCLCRAMEKDIDLAANCGVWGAIIEVPVSYVRLKYQFGWKEEEVIEKALRVASYAKEKGLSTYLFMIDSTRAREEFLQKLLTTVVPKARVDRVSVVDTAGCVNTGGMGYLVRKVSQWVDVPIEVHCHNDFGLGVANSLASIENGAESISCTVSSFGQRAGNAATEELAMALQYLYGLETGLDFEALYEVVQRIHTISGWKFPPNKPVVGEKVFTWEAGIPVAALVKNPHTVEPFQPEIFARSHDIELGKKCGRANILWWLDKLNVSADEDTVKELVNEVKNEASRLKRLITIKEFKSLLEKFDLYSNS